MLISFYEAVIETMRILLGRVTVASIAVCISVAILVSESGGVSALRGSSERKQDTRHLFNPRIINGEPASKIYPFYGFFEIGCGASLVAPDMMLTAAQ